MSYDGTLFYLTCEQFKALYLHAANGGRGEADAFFDRLGYAVNLHHGRYLEALNGGIAVLRKCREIDADAYSRIHKGTAFYWLGTAAFWVHDYETATSFYDAAVSEDLRAGADALRNPTPALHFMQIEGEALDQAARELVCVAQCRIEQEICVYNERTGRPKGGPDPTISDVRCRFLRPALSPDKKGWRSLATAFISFFIERQYRGMLLELRPAGGSSEPFFLHLFKGCVLFESLLKGNPKEAPTAKPAMLGPMLKQFHVHLGIAKNLGVGDADFGTVLEDLANDDGSIQTAIRVTGKIRNTVGHDLGWVVAIDGNEYERLFRMVASSCLHAIACLY
jgi:hypothetical protein